METGQRDRRKRAIYHCDEVDLASKFPTFCRKSVPPVSHNFIALPLRWTCQTSWAPSCIQASAWTGRLSGMQTTLTSSYKSVFSHPSAYLPAAHQTFFSVCSHGNSTFLEGESRQWPSYVMSFPWESSDIIVYHLDKP